MKSILDRNQALTIMEETKNSRLKKENKWKEKVFKYIDMQIKKAAKKGEEEISFGVPEFITGIFEGSIFKDTSLFWDDTDNKPLYNLIYAEYTKRKFEIYLSNLGNDKREKLVICWGSIEEAKEENTYHQATTVMYKKYVISDTITERNKYKIYEEVPTEKGPYIFKPIPLVSISDSKFDHFESIQEAKEYIDNYF